MAFTLPEALKRITNPMMAGIAKSVVTYDAFSASIAIEPVESNSFDYTREGTLPSTAFIPDSGVTSEESSGTDDVINVKFRRLVGNLDTDVLAEVGGVGVAPGAHRARLIGKKAKATWRAVQDKMITGGYATGFALGSSANPFAAITAIAVGPHIDSVRLGGGSIKYTNAGTLWQFRAPGDADYGVAVAAASNGSYVLKSFNESYYITVTLTVASATTNGETTLNFTSSTNEFDGLNVLLDPGQLLGSTGSGVAYSLQQLDQLISLVKVPEKLAFVMNSALLEKHYSVLRSLGGTMPETTAVPGYVGAVPAYRGIPILRNDYILNNEVSNTASSAYLVSLSPDEGFFLAAQSQGSIETPDADPRTRPVAGFFIEDIGPLEGKDARRTRVRWIGAPCLRSKLAAARFRGILF